MFTKSDYIDYFKQLSIIESTMQKDFTKYAEKVSDPEMKQLFEQLAKDELAHEDIVKSILNIVKEKIQ